MARRKELKMKTAAAARNLLAGAAVCLLFLTVSVAARAEHKMYQGRTGLPAVRDSKGNVWLERGNVDLNVRGTSLVETASFRLHYPSGKLEKGADQIQVAVREDFYRSKDNGAGDLNEADARGFTDFSAAVDGRRQDVSIEPWKLNDKKDTATRWRTWWVHFTPGKVHTMTIRSQAPLGWDGGHRTVEFVSKDLGGWRSVPDLVEVRLNTPGRSEAHLAGLEPKPEDQSARGIRWVYRKVQPKRDIFVMLPPDYPTNRRASR
jgi:hypothetical protein